MVKVGRNLALVAVVLAGLAVGGMFLLYNPGASPIDSVTRDDSAGETDSDPALPTPSKTQESESPTETPPRSPDDDPGPLVARVVCLAPDGAPIPNLRLEFGPHGEAVTDTQGRASVAVSEAEALTVKADSDRWRLAKDLLPEQLSDEVTLYPTPIVALSVWAVCDDGTPWQGVAYLRVGRWGVDPESDPPMASRPGAWEQTLRFDGVQAVEVANVPLEEDLRLYFRTSRIPGVSEQWQTLRRESVRHGELVTVTLTRDADSEFGVIEVDLHTYTGTGRAIRVLPVGSTRSAAGGPFTREVWSTPQLPAGDYVVRLDGNPPWETRVTVVAGRVVRVAYTHQRPATVQLRVLDRLGEPIPNAVLARGTSEYINHDFAVPAAGNLARADDEGNITLEGVGPGQQDFQVEARGYVPHTLNLELSEGETRYVGDIVLTPATGVITVRLTGMDDDASVTVMLLQPGGGAVQVKRDVAQAVVAFEGLPHRAYTVAVIAGRGGKPASSNVELTVNAPEQTVTLDVSGLVEDPLGRD